MYHALTRTGPETVNRAATPVAAIALLLGAAVPGRPPQPNRVQIHNFAFSPAADTVRVGQAVTFRNRDLVPHTATADSAGFDSGTIAADGSWRFVARRRGAVAYHCRFHPTMHGTLVIR